MSKSKEKYVKWLSTLSTEEAWKRIVTDAADGTRVDPEKLLKSISPLPDFKKPTGVGRWFDLVLAKIDLDMSVEEAKVLHVCCDALTDFFKKTA